MARNATESDFVKKKVSCVCRICVRLSMSTSSNNTSSWCLYRVNTASQRDLDLLCRNSFNISSSPYMGEHEHPNHHIVARPKSHFTTLFYIPIVFHIQSSPIVQWSSINSQHPFHYFTWHLVSESFSLQQSLHYYYLINSSNPDIIPGASQWPACKPFGDIIYPVFALRQIHQF